MPRTKPVIKFGQTKIIDDLTTWRRLKTESSELFAKARLVLQSDRQIIIAHSILQLEMAQPDGFFLSYAIWKKAKESTDRISKAQIRSVLENFLAREIIVTSRLSKTTDPLRTGRPEDALVQEYTGVRLAPDIPGWIKNSWEECAGLLKDSWAEYTRLRAGFADRMQALSKRIFTGENSG